MLLELVIHVPENSSIEVSGVSADIDVDEVLGEMRLHTVSGDMTSNVYGSDVQIETVSGDIELQGNTLIDRSPSMTSSRPVALRTCVEMLSLKSFGSKKSLSATAAITTSPTNPAIIIKSIFEILAINRSPSA